MKCPIRRAGSVSGFCLLVLVLLGSSLSAQDWVITGQVTDPSAQGIAAVDIDVFISSTGDEILSLSGDTTAANGSFTLTILGGGPIGNFDLAFTPSDPQAGFFPTTSQYFLAGSTAVGAIVLDPGVYLTGQVVNELGTGLSDVDLDVIDTFGDPVDVLGDFTDSLGQFQMLVPLGTFHVELKATALTLGGPFVPLLFEDVPLGSPLDLGVLTLPDGYSLTGTVQTSGGLPIIDADVDVTDPVTGDRVFTPGDNTDATGNFSILVPAGDWLVEVDPPTGALLVPVEIEFTVLPTSNSVGIVTLVSGSLVSGRTVNIGATPESDVDLDFVITSSGIEIPTAHDNAGIDGLFSVVVPNNTYDIVFRPPFSSGLAPKTVPGVVVAGAVGLGDVVLEAGNAITGTVTANATPVFAVEISMVDSVTQIPLTVFGGDTNLLGQYQYRQVSGTYDITFTPPVASGLSTLTELGVVVSGDTVLDVELNGVPPTDTFLRGDGNQDGNVNLADAVAVLEALFSGGTLLCPDAGDANDDGGVDISDAIFLLSFLFSGGATPPPPYPSPGLDPTADALNCS